MRYLEPIIERLILLAFLCLVLYGGMVYVVPAVSGALSGKLEAASSIR